MLKVTLTPSSANDGSGSCAAALRFNSSYLVGARLNRNSKNASSAVTLGAMSVSRRCTVVKSGGGNGAPRPPPDPPGPPDLPDSAPPALPPLPAPPADAGPIAAAAPSCSVAYRFLPV